jgi:plastocyanin
MLPSNNVSKVYFVPGLSGERFTIELTKRMNPPDDVPQSSWILSSNKGIKMDSRQLEVTINEERFEGKKYIIDTTLKNVGNLPLTYSPSNFMVKDESGVPYAYDLFYKSLSPLLSGELPPGEQVRGDTAFDIDKPGQKMMVLYSGTSGIPFLNSGSSPVQSASAGATNGTSVEIALGSSLPSNGEFYVPETLNVSKGASVPWTNDDSTLTVTSGTPEGGESGTMFDSSYLASGKTFEWTFNDAGTFDYYCTLHPFMTGKVIVK